jgi:hypothetical protein
MMDGTEVLGRLSDTWTTQSPNGNTVTFKIRGITESGFEYSADAVGRKIVKVRIWGKLLARAKLKNFSRTMSQKVKV